MSIGTAADHGAYGAKQLVEARIAGLCDAFVALIRDRPWRKAIPIPGALHLIDRESGTRFDPELGPRFTAFVRDLYWVRNSFEELLVEEASANSYVQAREQLDRLMKAPAREEQAVVAERTKLGAA